MVERPEPTDTCPQHLCLDKGYDNPTGHAATTDHDYVPHVRRIGEEKLDDKGRKKHPARRWVVERALGWLSKCRGIPVRYATKACNGLAFIKLACLLLWFRRLLRLEALRSFLSQWVPERIGRGLRLLGAGRRRQEVRLAERLG